MLYEINNSFRHITFKISVPDSLIKKPIQKEAERLIVLKSS